MLCFCCIRVLALSASDAVDKAQERRLALGGILEYARIAENADEGLSYLCLEDILNVILREGILIGKGGKPFGVLGGLGV